METVTKHIDPEKSSKNNSILFSRTKENSNPYFFQPKLQVNQPNDIYEQEADLMADKVMRMTDKDVNNQNTFFKPSGNSIQRKCNLCKEEKEKLQRKESGSSESTTAPQIVHDVLSSSSGKSLDSSTRSFFEPRFGYNFSNVKVHTGSEAAKSAQSINALAYTSGNNIVFGDRQYAPETNTGKKLIAHELTHVLQQNKVVVNAIFRSCGDEAVNWYNPFIRIASYDSTCLIQYANVDLSSVKNFNTDWKRDAIGTGLVSALAGVATTVLGKRLGLSQLASLIFGASSGFARGYVGITMKERIRGKTVNVHNWYGKYKYNALHNELLAVSFQGKGPNVLTIVAPWYYDQAFFDANNNLIANYIYTNEMDIPGVNLDNITILPEISFGVI
ncbi:MAG: DUF4157 domain-containing protein [Ignavibacteriae bacterium]|nr:MAG: DUF4157 domain-containing protein [Ignavibacteriota bacterium]